MLIVGSGFAGYAAALHAHDAGADVMIIDKRGNIGGNSLKCDGDIAVCNSSAQKEHGVQDSVDNYVNDMLVAGLNLNDIEKCRLIAERSNEIFEWLNSLGVTWAKDDSGKTDILPYGGHSTRRTTGQEQQSSEPSEKRQKPEGWRSNAGSCLSISSRMGTAASSEPRWQKAQMGALPPKRTST